MSTTNTFGTSSLEVTPIQADAAEKIAQFVVRFSLTIPAILSLESFRPVSFIGSQFMHVFSPVVSVLHPVTEWDQLAKLLEHRQGIEYLIERIEECDAQRSTP